MAEETKRRLFKPRQYRFLIECSKRGKEGIERWNRWRLRHPDKDILLAGVDLKKCYLMGICLNGGEFTDESGVRRNFSGMVVIWGTHLENACLFRAHLENAWLVDAHLEDAILWEARLENAQLIGADVRGVDLSEAHLQGADFSRAIVDGSTLVHNCDIDRKTKFEGVGLGNIRIYPAERQLLEYNIRRMNWEEWYGRHPKLRRVVEPFWWMSDYGLSTKRVIFTFFGLAALFANIYGYWALNAPPGIVNGVTVTENGTPVPILVLPIRVLYFSIVTMTTLGFGDMYARANSFWGHLLLTVQVLLGYVLLGALVTRLAILFTAGGPAGEFASRESADEGAQTEKKAADVAGVRE